MARDPSKFAALATRKITEEGKVCALRKPPPAGAKPYKNDGADSEVLRIVAVEISTTYGSQGKSETRHSDRIFYVGPDGPVPETKDEIAIGVAPEDVTPSTVWTLIQKSKPFSPANFTYFYELVVES